MISSISLSEGIKSGVGRPLRGFESESQMMNLIKLCHRHLFWISIYNIDFLSIAL